MNGSSHISQEDLIEFALQFLPPEEMNAAYEHLLTCDDCRRQVMWIQGDLASYALTAEAQEIPAGARERLMRRVSKENKLVSIDRPALLEGAEAPATRSAGEPGLYIVPKRRSSAAAWAGWAVAACALVVAGVEYRQNTAVESDLRQTSATLSASQDETAHAKAVLAALTDAGAMNVELRLTSGAEPPRPEGHASYLAKTGSLVFIANHMAPLAPNKTYELWLLPTEKGAAPVPAGTFKPDANGTATILNENLAQGQAAAGFGVTIEPDGGSTGPTLPIIIAGS
jgi:hypothetical protein